MSVDLVAFLGAEFLAYPEEELAGLFKEGDDEEALANYHASYQASMLGEFQDDLDKAQWELLRGRALVFKLTDDRIEPFDVARMYKQVSERHYSALLGRPITTFVEACRHALQLCALYNQEDSIPSPEQVEQDKQAKADAIAVTQALWKEAVATSRLVKAEQDVLVATARANYRKARGKG